MIQPIGSMYGKMIVNVGKYTIHGWYGQHDTTSCEVNTDFSEKNPENYPCKSLFESSLGTCSLKKISKTLRLRFLSYRRGQIEDTNWYRTLSIPIRPRAAKGRVNRPRIFWDVVLSAWWRCHDMMHMIDSPCSLSQTIHGHFQSISGHPAARCRASNVCKNSLHSTMMMVGGLRWLIETETLDFCGENSHKFARRWCSLWIGNGCCHHTAWKCSVGEDSWIFNGEAIYKGRAYLLKWMAFSEARSHQKMYWKKISRSGVQTLRMDPSQSERLFLVDVCFFSFYFK